MANLDEDTPPDAIGGPGPWTFDLPMDGGSEVFQGSLCTQLTATGCVVPYSTASAGKVVGVAQHAADNTAGADGAIRVRVETGRVYCFDNGEAGDAFSEASLIGSAVYGTDDHTVADNSDTQAREAVGFFMGMEADGKVRVLVVPWLNGIADASLNPA